MIDIPFVDAHVHLWDLSRISYPWLTAPFNNEGPNGSVESIARTYLLDDYLADAARWNISGIVHIEAGAVASSAVEETSWVQALADARNLPSAIVGFAALDSPNLQGLLEQHASHRSMRGIRHIVNWHEDRRWTYTPHDVTRDPQWEKGLGMLSRYGLSFDLQCYPGQMLHLAEIISRHRDTQVILNHAGMPVDRDPSGKDQWRRGMRALAALPNVATKLSGYGFVHRFWSVDQIAPYMLETIEMFGVSRCMFASDFPTDKLFGSFDRHLEAYHAIVKEFSHAERCNMFARNAERIYRLKQ
jgi:predicted TIM-barrel fold metal-dependent hydrolase